MRDYEAGRYERLIELAEMVNRAYQFMDTVIECAEVELEHLDDNGLTDTWNYISAFEDRNKAYEASATLDNCKAFINEELEKEKEKMTKEVNRIWEEERQKIAEEVKREMEEEEDDRLNREYNKELEEEENLKTYILRRSE